MRVEREDLEEMIERFISDTSRSKEETLEALRDMEERIMCAADAIEQELGDGE